MSTFNAYLLSHPWTWIVLGIIFAALWLRERLTWLALPFRCIASFIRGLRGK